MAREETLLNARRAAEEETNVYREFDE